MKKLTLSFLILFVLLSFGNVLQKKSYKTIKVIYHGIRYNQKDSTVHDIPNMEFRLSANDSVSRFEYIPSLEIDEGSKNFLARAKLAVRDVYFINVKQKKYLKQKHLNDYFLIEMPLMMGMKWKLDFSRPRKILGYTCYKAIGEMPVFKSRGQKDLTYKSIPSFQRIEAWFTPEIPLPYGPYRYVGLPGLVLEAYNLSSGGFGYRAAKIDFSEKKREIPEPKEGVHMSFEESGSKMTGYFNKMMKENMKKPCSGCDKKKKHKKS